MTNDNSGGGETAKTATKMVTVPSTGTPKRATIVVLVGLFSYICYEAYRESQEQLLRVLAVGTASVVCYFLVSHFIGTMSSYFQKGGLHGKDINKRGTPAGEIPIPESLGLVSAVVYIVVLCLLHIPGDRDGESDVYTIAMACVTFMTLLGFTDDVIDLKWRHKIVLPLFASLPLLVNYRGHTTVNVPRFVHPFLTKLVSMLGVSQEAVVGSAGKLVDLGFGYYIYMAMLSTFCANSINIHAGINGLEAGQVAVISAFAALHNAFNLNPSLPKDNIDILRKHHSSSLDMMLPLLAVTLGLLYHNWYPSRVFVGDTFCNFSGMAIAMASILGHYSLTLLLLFLPQLINFIYSLPQLFGIIACPRHRLPTFDRESGKLVAVKSHMNLVNLTLWICGPMTESTLCIVLLIFQTVCCSMGLMLRALYLNYVS